MTDSIFVITQQEQENIINIRVMVDRISQALDNLSPQIREHIKNEIFYQLISKSLSSGDDKKVYHLDVSHTKIEQEVLVDSNVKISNYYLGYIRSINNKDANV